MAGKQAIVLIHGMGEQRPMETLRGFVKTLWIEDDEVRDSHARKGLWSKPDAVSDSFELRRLTTSKNRCGVYTDFFEFYWAHMMQGTKLGHVWSWARTLLVRWPWRVPRPFFGVWLLLVVVLALAVAFAVNATLPRESKLFGLAPWVSVGISLGLIPLLEVILRQVVGDAARYLNPAPSNIQVRQRIRSAGVTLLQKLHERGYERIVIVGHSLGSVIGYDVLTHAWAQYHTAHETRDPAHTALEDLEEAARGDDAEAYRKKQAQYAVELQCNGNPWRVTDFVTLGSPLGHAAVLLARNGKDLKQRQADRELPTCPPVLETQKQDGAKIQRFSFPLSWEDPYGHSKQIRVPHHAAVFGPVRWTNLYFPAHFVIWGDVISGPVAPAFGVGVEDVPVSTRIRAGFISHTLYWKLPRCQRTAPHVEKLRRAVRLAE